MKTILVPVDFSAVSSTVCKAACELARRMRASLLLVHVVQSPIVVSDLYGSETAYIQAALDAASEAGELRLAALKRVCAKQGIKTRTYQTVGDPVFEILNCAKKAAFIVLGSHGHGAMYDLLVGSTAHGVLKRAKCPVMVVPDKSRS